MGLPTVAKVVNWRGRSGCALMCQELFTDRMPYCKRWSSADSPAAGWMVLRTGPRKPDGSGRRELYTQGPESQREASYKPG